MKELFFVLMHTFKDNFYFIYILLEHLFMPANGTLLLRTPQFLEELNLISKTFFPRTHHFVSNLTFSS